jgi:hypothetical protein
LALEPNKVKKDSKWPQQDLPKKSTEVLGGMCENKDVFDKISVRIRSFGKGWIRIGPEKKNSGFSRIP